MKSLRAATRDTFQSLSVRNFRLFFTGQVISQVGNWLTLVAQTLLVLQLTDSGVALGILAAAQFGPILILGPFAGLIADRSDKRKLLLIVQTIAMAQSFVLAALAFSGNPPVAAIYAVAFIGGLTMAFDNPARRSFVVEMVGDDAINNAVSLNSAIMTSSRIVGPGPRRIAGRHRRLRLGLPGRRPVLHRRADRALDDPHRGAAPGAGDTAGPRARCAKACVTPAACRSCGCRW